MALEVLLSRFLAGPRGAQPGTATVIENTKWAGECKHRDELWAKSLIKVKCTPSLWLIFHLFQLRFLLPLVGGNNVTEFPRYV